MAEEMLKKNNSNRSISNVRVKKYAGELVKDLWVLNGETIKTTKDGNVIDGQHRLLAIIKSGIPMKTYIIDDLENSDSKKLFSTVDQGKARSLSDILSCQKIKNNSRIAAISNHLKWIYNFSSSFQPPTNLIKDTKYEMLNYTLVHIDVIKKWYEITSKLHNQTKIISLPISTAFAVYLDENKVDESIIEDFFNKLFLGFGGIKESPNQLRNFITKISLSKIRHGEVQARFYLTTAWNSFMNGKQFYPNLNKFENADCYPEIKISED
jgi:hypothetical protein